jgi:hypothetical protein
MEENSFLDKYKSDFQNRNHKVPEGYFENFEERIMNRIDSKNNNSNVKYTIFKSNITFKNLAIAASFLILIFSGYFAFFSNNSEVKSHQVLLKKNVDKEIAELKKEEVQDFLEIKSTDLLKEDNPVQTNIGSDEFLSLSVEQVLEIPVKELENMEEEEEILNEIEISELLAMLSEDDLTALNNSIIK